MWMYLSSSPLLGVFTTDIGLDSRPPLHFTLDPWRLLDSWSETKAGPGQDWQCAMTYGSQTVGMREGVVSIQY